MADWKNLAINLVLADGEVDDAEVRVLRKELLADDVIDKAEVRFLIELRNQAQKKAKSKKIEVNPRFENFFFKAIEMNVLKDGAIDAREANWLREMLFADNKIDDSEKKFLRALKKKATKTSPKFDALYDECLGEGDKPAAAKPKAAPKRGTRKKK